MERYTNLVESNSDNKITTSNYSSNNSIEEKSRTSIYLEKYNLDSVIQIDQEITLKEKRKFRERCLEIIQMEINDRSQNQNQNKDNDNDNDKENNYQQEEVVYCRNIHKTYLIGLEGVPALRGVSLKVKKGEFLIILGTSGGGK